jgi:hypothetical protein
MAAIWLWNRKSPDPKQMSVLHTWAANLFSDRPQAPEVFSRSTSGIQLYEGSMQFKQKKPFSRKASKSFDFIGMPPENVLLSDMKGA